MLKNKLLSTGLIIFSGLLLITTGCRTKEAPLPDNLVQFESDHQGLPANTQEVVVKLKLSRAADRDIAITVGLTPTNISYTTHFTTLPAAPSGTIPLTINSGAMETEFKVVKTPGILLNGDEKIVFKIESSATPVIIGSANIFTLEFAEIISKGSTIEGNGGGVTYGNKIFFDLSANSQTSVLRTKWDLGFSSGDAWRVILNSSTFMLAKKLEKNDLNAVTAADTIGLAVSMYNHDEPEPESLPYIDYPDGDLSKTAIAEISATASENNVYIINRGFGIGVPVPERGWKKIRVIRNSNGGYTLQHADIAATSFTTVDIPKNTDYFFNYASFETGAVTIDPPKTKWDIAWTYFTNSIDFGWGELPYAFQDFIIQNRNVEIARVDTTAIKYVNFKESDLASQTFKKTQNALGSTWRMGGGPGLAPKVYDNRYYIIKDNDNNYYKLRFTAMTKNGERGHVGFEYALVKQGD